MTSREAFLQSWAAEAATTQRVLDAVPSAHPDYRPDPKSRTGLELAGFVAGHGPILAMLLETGEIGRGPMPAPRSVQEAIAPFAAVLPKLERLIKGGNDDEWDTKKTRLYGPDGKVMMETTLGQMVWFTLYDLIHHRGQLSTYIRAMGGKVPSIYGPSADTNGGPAR
jgi:uncharacterized damage-inducible protein DinB